MVPWPKGEKHRRTKPPRIRPNLCNIFGCLNEASEVYCLYTLLNATVWDYCQNGFAIAW